MVEVKREDITLQDWTKGISADEFAWGSYYYSEWISSGYSTKGFELWYRYRPYLINTRKNGYATAIVASNNYGFMWFTADGRVETEDFWNAEAKGALYATHYTGTPWTWYLNWITYGKYAIGIKQEYFEVLDYENLFDENTQLLPDTDFSDTTPRTIGTGWTLGDDWMEHTTWETGTLSITPTGTFTNNDFLRVVVKVKGWTSGNLALTLGNGSSTVNDRTNGIFVLTLRCTATPALVITPTSQFDWIIESVEAYQYDMTAITTNKTVYNWNDSQRHPALVWEWDLYIASWHTITITSLVDWGQRSRDIIDANFNIVSMTQQAWNIIIWATDGYDSRQYYWNWVDAVATEVIEWKWLLIKWVTGTETISYVLTTSWATSGSIEWYEYRLYAVSWYQRSLIATKLAIPTTRYYLEEDHYNPHKRFDFNDVKSDNSMCIFLDSLYIPWCDWVYKYGYDVPWLRSSWTRPIKYATGSTNIVVWQRGHFLGIGLTTDWSNYIGNVDNRIYTPTWYLVTEAIYWDRLSTKKSLEKLKIWYKNVASSVGNIKLYAIVDDTYFWRFRPTTTPTVRPSLWDVYEVANNTTARVINVDTTEWVITLATVSDGWSYSGVANTTLTKVSWEWDDSIVVGYNFDNMCHIKTIESENQTYGSDLVFGKDFISSNMPYRYKIQFVIELNSNDRRLSPEVYEFSMHSDIDDVVL